MNYRTKRRYQVEFHFNPGKKVIKREVTTYSMAEAIKKVESQLWEQGSIRWG